RVDRVRRGSATAREAEACVLRVQRLDRLDLVRLSALLSPALAAPLAVLPPRPPRLTHRCFPLGAPTRKPQTDPVRGSIPTTMSPSFHEVLGACASHPSLRSISGVRTGPEATFRVGKGPSATTNRAAASPTFGTVPARRRGSGLLRRVRSCDANERPPCEPGRGSHWREAGRPGGPWHRELRRARAGAPERLQASAESS